MSGLGLVSKVKMYPYLAEMEYGETGEEKVPDAGKVLERER